MSCNYAEGLSPYEHKGKLGIPEIFDDPVTADEKIEKLAEWMKAAKHTVVHTGAGISTSAGIPDFRGPNGVWTLEEKGEKPKMNVSFDLAAPTFTHMALRAFTDSGLVKYIVSQNIDGLHLRSGLKRSSMSELHGNMFVAKCSYCDRQFIQGNAVPTVGQKDMGMNCPWVKAGGRVCRGKLHDSILDWEHDLPERELEMADMHSTLSDLSISLGTTLQIVPAGNLPLKAKKNGGKVVIVNLQPTKHNKKADLVIHLQVDKVLQKLTAILGLNVPPYTPDVDPTRVIKRSMEMGLKPKSLDWTISASSVTKLKAIVDAKKGKKSDKKPVAKKRRRPINQDDDSSSDESEIPKPKFTINDEEPAKEQIQPQPRLTLPILNDNLDHNNHSFSSISSDLKDIAAAYGVPLDLSSPSLLPPPTNSQSSSSSSSLGTYLSAKEEPNSKKVKVELEDSIAIAPNSNNDSDNDIDKDSSVDKKSFTENMKEEPSLLPAEAGNKDEVTSRSGEDKEIN